jgi:hypothetical protein
MKDTQAFRVLVQLAGGNNGWFTGLAYGHGLRLSICTVIITAVDLLRRAWLGLAGLCHPGNLPAPAIS